MVKKSLKKILKDIAYQSQHYTVTYWDREKGNIRVPATDVIRLDGGLLQIRGAMVPIHRIARITDTRTGEPLIERRGIRQESPVSDEKVSIHGIYKSNTYDIYRFTDEILTQLTDQLTKTGWEFLFTKAIGDVKTSEIHLDRTYKTVTVMSENPLYGTSVVKIGNGDFRVYRGYPHLLYYDQFLINCRNGFWIEEKLNGTCIRITPILGNVVYGTRRNLQAQLIPIFNKKFDKDLLETYPDIYQTAYLESRKEDINWLKIVPAMKHVIRTFSYNGLHQLARKGYTVFCELYGYGNPIQIDDLQKYGVYEKFLDIRVIDICDTRTHQFLDLPTKQQMCRDYRIPVVTVAVDHPTPVSIKDLHTHIEALKTKASDNLLEGMVLKTIDHGLVMAKIKPIATKHFAIAESEGNIPEVAFQHAFTKIAQGLDWLEKTPESEIVDQIISELTADFYLATIEMNREGIIKFVRKLKTRDAVRIEIEALLEKYDRNGTSIQNPSVVMPLLTKAFPNIKTGFLYQMYRQALSHLKMA